MSWLQFADDTAIVTTLEQDNQLLCNAFTINGLRGLILA